jgi:hypothetical protein
VILGSVVAAIGVAALVVHLSRGQSRQRVLLWFGLFARPYGTATVHEHHSIPNDVR